MESEEGGCQLFSKSQHTLDPFLLLPHGVNLLTGPGEAGSATRPASDPGVQNKSGPNSGCTVSQRI